MCGILGIIAAPSASVGVEQQQVIAMRDVMESRGPDGAGLFEKKNVVLAHRRLAIRDLAAGRQPWISEDGQCALVYNGEIYNDVSLRTKLMGYGHRFRTRCDTEVVMAAYRQWGTECVQHLRGMFAFGVYDFRNERLFLARDHFGVKPLFLTELNGCLVFASSIAALLRHPQIVKAPNLPVISHYLTTFRNTLGRDTVYQNIWQLMPGECLTGRADEYTISRYWEYPQAENRSIGFDDAQIQLQSGLRESVGQMLASDVPVGMFLSGGVDSSTIACFMREAKPGNIVAECGGGDEGEAADFQYARRCAEHLEFEYRDVRVSPDEYFDDWQWLLEQYATPVSTPSDVIIYRLAASLKKSVGVVLGGEGADELLCGYAVQHWSGQDFDRQFSLASGNWEQSAAAARLFQTSLRKCYGRDRFESLVDHYFTLNSLIPTSAKSSLFSNWAWNLVDQDRQMLDYYSNIFEEYEGESALRRYELVLHRINLESLLSRLDSATMLAGLEARVPYADHKLVEAMFRVPNVHKICVGRDEQAPCLAAAELELRGSLQSKRVLRAVAESHMPDMLAHRKKASFPTPVQAWLTGPWKERAGQIVVGSRFGRTLFRTETLQELTCHAKQAGMWMWPLLNVLIWGDKQFGG